MGAQAVSPVGPFPLHVPGLQHKPLLEPASSQPLKWIRFSEQRSLPPRQSASLSTSPAPGMCERGARVGAPQRVRKPTRERHVACGGQQRGAAPSRALWFLRPQFVPPAWLARTHQQGPLGWRPCFALFAPSAEQHSPSRVRPEHRRDSARVENAPRCCYLVGATRSYARNVRSLRPEPTKRLRIPIVNAASSARAHRGVSDLGEQTAFTRMA